MATSYDEDEQEPHMLAVGDDGSLHDDDEEDILDPEEEMMMIMQTEEAAGKTTPPPLEHDEGEVYVVPKPSVTTNGAVDDSFESYIFDSDGDEDFQARGRNHVIPVINSSPTKKKRPANDILTDPSTSPQSPPSDGDRFPGRRWSDRETYGDMYISPPSSSDYGPSPKGAQGAPVSAFSPNYQLSHGSQSTMPPSFRYMAPVSQTPPLRAVAPSAQSAPPHTRKTTPTIPDRKTPVILETSQQGYRQSSSKSNMEQPSSSSRKKSSSRSNKNFMYGMSKPVFCILVFYIVFITASFAYFVYQYVQSSSLREQVEALSAEVDRLEAQVDELEKLISDFNVTVVELSGEVSELQVENDKLETQNAILADANGTFGNQTADLQKEIDYQKGIVSNLTLENEVLKEEVFNLEVLNGELTNLTQSLNETNIELAARADNLTAVNNELVESNEALRNQTEVLQANLGELVLEFDAAYENLVELQDEVAVLQEENDRLGNLTESLGAILSFLEETNQDADLTVDQLASQLEEQITNSRRLVLENLQNTMKQRTQSWNCDYINEFAGSSFTQDYNVPIPGGDYDSVMDFVESRVLTDLCLDRSAFELYLSVNFMPSGDGLTSNELISGMALYTSAALNYYFPDSVETGLAPEEWAEASYDCSNLPTERQYE